MKYDDASWHYRGEFPEGSPEEYGATHIALYIRWCFSKGWAGEIHLNEAPEEVEQVILGEMLATDFFKQYCDGKFTDEDLDIAGNKFTAKYYDKSYFKDYAEICGDKMYVASELEHDFAALSSQLNRRWKKTNIWKFW